MKSSKNLISNFNKTTDESTHRFVERNLDIVSRVHAIMHEKGVSQQELANRMGKTEHEISNWLTGMYNLTLKNIAEMEVALGETIIS